MSATGDSAVFDYFSLLLKEPISSIGDDESDLAVAEPGLDRRPAPEIEPVTKLMAEDIDNLMTATLDKPEVDRAVLERLLAPVVSPEVETEKVDPGVMTSPEVKIAPRVKASTKAQTKAKTSAQTGTRVEDSPVSKLAEPEVKTKLNTSEEEPATATEPVRRLADIVAEDLAGLTSTKVTPETQTGSVPPANTGLLADSLEDDFQVLFFKIAGLTLAVPLVSLGGIVRLEKLNHIIGRPAWYLGLQNHRGEQINVVDTCAWVMPEHIDKESVESKNYQYVVQLTKSNWGLACESLLNATRIDKSQVNWRTKPGKRPWLAGVVKEQMCGILNVDALITMLDAGLGCQDPIG
ncbi:chemotaxis protein CheW [Shewanella submarina]|uniref:Chemotaxis protein CheW n=1 Tax=Shewanella submarina TaxID=2016376 RepID=A0ABV7GJJ7_9GAMM|nr:chemotaxis protein CheW [Shewanella submarina]MCL1036521.1 chemotaxis protein CheW [Shewanella submarina]